MPLLTFEYRLQSGRLYITFPDVRATAEMSSEASHAVGGAYHHGDLRNTLIAEGRLELERRVPSELSLRRLAQVVGVSATASVRHFSDKAEFLAAIAVNGFRELASIRWRIASTWGDPLTIAYRMMSAYVEFAGRHMRWIALMAGPYIVDREDYPELSKAAAAITQCV